MTKSLLFKNAHNITRKMVEKYHTNYQAQFKICLQYVYNQYKTYLTNQAKEYKKNILLTLNKLVNTNDERFNKYFKLYNKAKTNKNIQQYSYYLKSLNAYMSNTLGNKYVMFNPSWHEEYMVENAIRNINIALGR